MGSNVVICLWSVYIYTSAQLPALPPYPSVTSYTGGTAMDPPPAYYTTLLIHTLSYGGHMVNLIFGHIDNSRSFITRNNPPIWDAPLYIAVTFEPTMQFWLPF